MAAIIEMPRPNPSPSVPSVPRPHHDRPDLVALPGGRSLEGRRRRRLYLRRRVAVVLAAATVGYGLWAIAASPAPPSPGAAPVEVGDGHVVQRGDTLWTIAQGLGVDGDLRDTVSRLAEVNGGATLVPGQVLSIPADMLTP